MFTRKPCLQIKPIKKTHKHKQMELVKYTICAKSYISYIHVSNTLFVQKLYFLYPYLFNMKHQLLSVQT